MIRYIITLLILLLASSALKAQFFSSPNDILFYPNRSFTEARNWAIITNGTHEGDFQIATGDTNTSGMPNVNTTPGLAKLTITNTGRVGIGTTIPMFKLDVEGSTRIKNSATTSGSYTTFRVQGPDYANGLEIDFFGNNNYPADPAQSYGGGLGSVAIVNVNAKPLTFGTANTGRMIIDGVGNVGVGVFNPTNKFQIGTNPAAYSGNDFLVSNANGSLAINNTPSEAFLWADRAIAIRPGGAYALYVGSNANVGIGTTSTDAKLTVKGDIHTQEVRVDLTGAVTPDYVFEKDYNLLPLSEVEAYINANKHLPEVPSAKEMEAHGLNLKEMNLILLKKIEELTLHVIEIKKENETLKKENEVIRNEIKKLR